MQPSNLLFLAGFLVYLGIRGAYDRGRGTERSIRRADPFDQILMLLVFAGSVVLPILYLATPWLAFADYRLPPPALWVGAAVMVAALWLFWRSHADLGGNWSVTPEIRDGHRLVRHGVYRRIRHPMYAAIWLFGLAQGLLLQNWLAGWSALATFAPMYFVRTPREERLLREFFGDEYGEYMRQTGRVWPRMSRLPPD